MEKYLNCKSFLRTCECKFIDENIANPIELVVSDKISIEKIKKEKAHLVVNRLIKFTPFTSAYVNVAFDAAVEAKDVLDKNLLIKDIKAEVPFLGNIYSRISLIIAQVTNESMFGAVITPPMYESEQIEIIDNCNLKKNNGD